MTNITLGRSGVVEYIPETTFGTFPTNPAMAWVGLVNSFKAKIESINGEYRTLKASAATNKLQIEGSVLLGQSIEIDLEYLIQDWTFFKYVMSSSGGATLTDDLKPLSFGLITPEATPKYAKISGAMIDSATVEIPERGLAKCTMKLLAAHVTLTTNDPWSVTDYKGSGSHATKASTAPKKWSDITALTLGGANIPTSQAGGLKFTIENKLEPVLDAYGTLSTKIGAIEPTERNIKASLTLRKTAINSLSVFGIGYGANNLVYNLGGSGHIFTFTGARIPEDTIEFAPKGLTSVDVDFNGITDVAIT